MRAWRRPMLCVIFFLDVHVRAADIPKEKDAGCWGKSIPCVVQTKNNKRELQAGDFKLILAANSLLEQRSTNSIQLVMGDFYAEVKGELKFKTPYAEISCANECKGLFSRKAEEISIKSLGGQWVVKRLGDSQEYALHSGLRVTVSEVEENGMAHMEFPQGLPWAPTVKEWAKFYSGDYAHFKSELTVFRADWQVAIERASEVQFETATRSIASHQAEVNKEKARKMATQREDQELRRLFREKTGIAP